MATILCVNLQFGQLDNCGWHDSILLPNGIEFNIGNTRYSAPNIVDSRCAVY